MILTVKFHSVLDKDSSISHQAEVIVDNEEEAHEQGEVFCRMMMSFNEGIIKANEEREP